MKKVYFVIALQFLMTFAEAQSSFNWAKRAGLWAYDYGYAVDTDNNGNLYVAGKYELNNAEFNGTTVQCAGNHDMFLASYNQANGNLNWIRTAGGILGDYAQAMACDGTHLYVAGEMEGMNDVISFPGSTITLTTQGDNDLFLAKYDLQGNLLWAISEGTGNSEKALAVTYDNTGNVYIGGYFSTTGKFGTTNITGAGGRDIYLAKYNSSGVLQWVKNAGSSGRDEAKSIKCDNNGNVYICGMFSNNCDFSGQVLTTAQNLYQDAFIAKYSTSDGTLQWVRKGDADYDDVAWSMVFDNAGNIYATGEFNSFIKWGDPLKGVPTTGATNVYVVKMDPAGTVHWIKNAGGSLTDRARGIGSDGDNVFITGQFGGTASFGIHNISAADSSDIFMAALDGGGEFKWAIAVGGPVDAFEPLGYESGNSICAKGGSVFATGSILSNNTQTPNVAGIFGSTTLNGYDRTDAFICGMDLGIVIGLTENQTNLQTINIYPNPSNGQFLFDASKITGELNVKVYNTVGQLVQSQTQAPSSQLIIDLGAQRDGIYLVEMTTEDNSVIRKKLILQH